MEFIITRILVVFGNVLVFITYVGLAIISFRLSIQEKRFIGNRTFEEIQKQLLQTRKLLEEVKEINERK